MAVFPLRLRACALALTVATTAVAAFAQGPATATIRVDYFTAAMHCPTRMRSSAY